MESTRDFKIFGFTLDGQLRTNVYDTAGRMYTWITSKTAGHLAYRLEQTWEQPLTEAEWDAIDELEWARIACETCGGSGADPGGLDPTGEPCQDCNGSGIEPMLVTLRKSLGTWKPASANRRAA